MPGQDLHQRRLAGAVLADQRDDLAARTSKSTSSSATTPGKRLEIADICSKGTGVNEAPAPRRGSSDGTRCARSGWSLRRIDRIGRGRANALRCRRLRPAYVESCYFCPRNVRVGGARNPDYRSVFVFDNDHPCVGPTRPALLEPPPASIGTPRPPASRASSATRRSTTRRWPSCRRRDRRAAGTWRDQYLELGAHAEVRHVLIFENKGEVVGVSNPHPHGQIYATNFVFKTIETEAAVSRRYYDEHGRVLFQDIIRAEQEDGRRILFENDVGDRFRPYFARYAYECYVAPKETHASLATLSAGEMRDLAAALKSLLVRYDNLWQMSFPYVLTLHQAPTDGGDHRGFHFHIEFHPPLRKPHLLKYLAGPRSAAATS